MKAHVLWVSLSFILMLMFSAVTFGQAGRGGISGTVTDPAGAVVLGAKVVLVDHATGATQRTVTSAAGLYSFISLNPGVYQVTASQAGFASVVRDKVAVSVDQVTEVNITLRVGAVSETVTVTEAADLVEPTNSTVGTLIAADSIDRVPLLTRDVFDLIQLSAGVTPANAAPNSSSSYAIENISTGRPGIDVSSYTINGAIVGSVYYMVDGSPIGVAENNFAAILPAMDIPEDAVSEVRVETQNTPASYQSGGAGVISLVSKSGTNKIHGDVFGVFRPDVLAANEYFNKQSELSSGAPNTPPAFHRYQEGAAIGGPIKRDKVFFFGDYEDTQQDLYDGSNFFTVPTTAERTGDFSAMSFAIYDPTMPDINGLRQQFPGNKITNPNPIALNFLSHFPKCNFPNPSTCDSATTDVANNFFVPGLDPTTAHRFDVRVDWNKSDRQRIFTRFSFDRLFNSTFNAFNSMWDPNYAQNVTNARNILVADDLTLNSSTVLQLRYSFTRHYENQGGDPGQVGTSLTQLGFPASLAAAENYRLLPIIVFNDYPPNGNQLGGTGNYNTFLYASENSDANAAITKVWRKHEISTGFEWMKRYLNIGQPPAPSGAYTFDISATDQSDAPSVTTPVGGSDFASFLVGMGTAPGTEENTFNGYPNFSKDIFAAEANPYYAAFFEDTYHPSKTLTITAGLRWDIFGGRTERFNRQEYFNQTATNAVNGVSYTGAEVYVNGNNRSPYTTNLTNFGPRLGFAWQPIQHLVVRGGAGFYYGPSTENVATALFGTDGFSSSTLWNATCFNADMNTVYNGTSACPTPTPGVYTSPYSVSNPFPNGVVPTLTSPPPGLGNNLGIILNTVLHSQPTPTTYNFNFGLEYELPHQVIVSAAYVGSRGLFLPLSSVDLNDLDLATIAKYQSTLVSTTVPNKWAAIQPPTNANFGSPTVPLFVSVEQYPQFGSGSYGDGNGVIVHGYPAGDSEYSSLQTKVQKRLTGHFTTLASFTWGKLMTDDSQPPLNFVGSHLGKPQDWRDLQYEHSVSPQDVKYQFTGQVSYDLPVGKGRRVNLNGVSNAILGGWTTNAIVYASTGIPIVSPIVGASFSYIPNQRPDLTCNPATGAPHTAAVWFNPNCFSFPASQFVPGNAPAYLDGVRTMGAQDLDLSLYKTFSITESKNLRFEVSSYNVTNRAQFAMPNVPTLTVVSASPSTAAFGQITSTINTPRQFQFGARFSF
ncbi:MAG TPA: carboxypeptidase regulatory-like domain-containing protein [Terriglobales bacterium]|nr:carboxypeptidase regulatory-like domain-containing protein [Terriglobales bacterium]